MEVTNLDNNTVHDFINDLSQQIDDIHINLSKYEKQQVREIQLKEILKTRIMEIENITAELNIFLMGTDTH